MAQVKLKTVEPNSQDPGLFADVETELGEDVQCTVCSAIGEFGEESHPSMYAGYDSVLWCNHCGAWETANPFTGSVTVWITSADLARMRAEVTR
jgi:hypothetical protein